MGHNENDIKELHGEISGNWMDKVVMKTKVKKKLKQQQKKKFKTNKKKI
jgi:hypothetical protein